MVVVDGIEFQEPHGQFAQPLTAQPLSKGVVCLYGWSQDWGPNQWRTVAHNYKRSGAAPATLQQRPVAYTEDWARKRVEEALARVGKGLVIAAFPSYVPYNKNAALLREYGFRLLGKRCYPNANYPISSHSTMSKGNIYSVDGYPHWIHIWVKDLKGLETCGEADYGVAKALPGAPPPIRPAITVFPHCCGLRLRFNPADQKPDPYTPNLDPNKHLAVCQIPADQKFPKGWQRFALYRDFKWGVNFGSPHVKGVQTCIHEFDLARIEKWELEQKLP